VHDGEIDTTFVLFSSKNFINFCQNDPIFPIYDVMLLEQVNSLNLLAYSLQISMTFLADRGRNIILL
jgi:hypothetical protein